MGNFKLGFVNNDSLTRDIINIKMVNISWEGGQI